MKTFMLVYNYLKVIKFVISPHLLCYYIYFFIWFQALGVFGLCQLHCFVDYIRSKMSPEDFQVLFKAVVMASLGVSLAVGGILTVTGKHVT